MINAPSASYSVTVRLEIDNRPGMLGKVTSAIGKAGGDIGAIDRVEGGKSPRNRDIRLKGTNDHHGQQMGGGIPAGARGRVITGAAPPCSLHLAAQVRGSGG